VPVAIKTTEGRAESIGQHNCACGQDSALGFCLSHEFLETIHAAVKLMMMLDPCADWCAIGKDFCCLCWRKARVIHGG
jgi:hypothetical protein